MLRQALRGAWFGTQEAKQHLDSWVQLWQGSGLKASSELLTTLVQARVDTPATHLVLCIPCELRHSDVHKDGEERGGLLRLIYSTVTLFL